MNTIVVKSHVSVKSLLDMIGDSYPVKIESAKYQRELTEKLGSSAMNSLVYACNLKNGWVTPNGQNSSKSTKNVRIEFKKTGKTTKLVAIWHVSDVMKIEIDTTGKMINLDKYSPEIVYQHIGAIGRFLSDWKVKIANADELDQSGRIISNDWKLDGFDEFGSALSEYGAACMDVLVQLKASKRTDLVGKFGIGLLNETPGLLKKSQSNKTEFVAIMNAK